MLAAGRVGAAQVVESRATPAVDPSVAEGAEGRNVVLSREGQLALGLFLLAATWWVFEVVPIGVTSILIGMSGAIALAIASECPLCEVIATDTSAAALGAYDRRLRDSYVVRDLYRTRNMRLAFKRGFFGVPTGSASPSRAR